MSGVAKAKRHGLRRTPEYQAWADMHARCGNPAHRQWKDYGGRGIHVCKRWADFRKFYADMGPRPTGLTLERKKNNRGYSPKNCVWATHHTQHRNTRQTILVLMDGRVQCLKDWCREIGIRYSTVQGRIYRRGWSPIEALTTPVNPNWRIQNLG